MIKAWVAQLLFLHFHIFYEIWALVPHYMLIRDERCFGSSQACVFGRTKPKKAFGGKVSFRRRPVPTAAGSGLQSPLLGNRFLLIPPLGPCYLPPTNFWSPPLPAAGSRRPSMPNAHSLLPAGLVCVISRTL